MPRDEDNIYKRKDGVGKAGTSKGSNTSRKWHPWHYKPQNKPSKIAREPRKYKASRAFLFALAGIFKPSE